MSSPRKGKGARITICCALLLMYTSAVIDMGTQLMSSYFTTMSAPRSKHGKRRVLGERDQSSTKLIDDTRRERRNNFINPFEDTLSNSLNPTSIDATAINNFVALMLKENEIYCRKSQMKYLSRSRYFVQMLREGLRQYPQTTSMQFADKDANATTYRKHGIPILVKHDDSNGCYPATQKDKYAFPRLTWSIPANHNTTNHYCSAIGMPSYKLWKDLNNRNEKVGTTQNTLNNDALYPWSTKLSKAVWRGSTTCNKGMHGHLALQDIPRSKLVKSSLDRSDLIDAGFHKLVGKYKDGNTNERTGRMIKEAIPLEEMMKYKGKSEYYYCVEEEICIHSC